MPDHVQELWVKPDDIELKIVYLCDNCCEIAFYWTDDCLKHPAQSMEEYEDWYESHAPYCGNNLKITKTDD